MSHPLHRPVFLRLALGLAATALLASGCSSKTKPASTANDGAPKNAHRYVSAMSTRLGRVISYDPAAANVLVEFSSFSSPPADLAGKALISRNPDTLAPTARLVAASHRTGRVFGAHVISGQPALGDEVAIPAPF